MDLLADASQLAAASLLRQPQTDREPDDPVQAWQDAMGDLVRPQQPHLLKAVAFSSLRRATDTFFPREPHHQPRLRCYRDVLWVRGCGALYDGMTGLALEGTYLSRFPRHQETPTCTTYRLALTRPVTAFPSLERAVLLPGAACADLGHFLTETLAFLWPWFTDASVDLAGCAVLLRGCRLADPLTDLLCSLLRHSHAFPLLEQDLPAVVHLQEVWVPDPSLRLQASWSASHLQTATALAEWLLAADSVPTELQASATKVYISRSGLGAQARCVDQERDLEDHLQRLGWQVFRPEDHSLAAMVSLFRRSRVLAGFEGAALHALACLGQGGDLPLLVMLGDAPGLDYFLQWREQGLPGFYIQCTRPDPARDEPLWRRPRLLNAAAESLAAMIDSLAAAV